MARYTPPAIPEIAKAFENDPRTKLARNSLALGSSTAPVAQGGYAWADGLARALQGVLGAVIEKKVGKKYAADEEELLRLRRERAAGLDVLQDTQTSPTPQTTAQIAEALGAPAPVDAKAPGLPGLPPVPPPQAPQAAPGPASAPLRPQMAPPAPASPASAPQAPQAAPAPQPASPNAPPASPGLPPAAMAPQAAPGLPGMPPPLSAPVAPTAVPATRSPRLGMAARMMRDGNRYEAAAAQDMLDKGLGEQGTFNEAAAGRQATIDNTGYQGALSGYNQDRAARVQGAFQAADREDTQDFTLTRDERLAAFDMRRAGFDRETAYGLARLNNDAAWLRTVATISASNKTAEEKRADRRTAFFSTPTGAKIWDSTNKVMEDAAAAKEQINEFLRLNEKTGTGGIILGNAPGALTWSDKNYQQMERITQSMSINMSTLLKGAVSDKEGDRIIRAGLTIKNKPAANMLAGQQMAAAIDRVNDFQRHKLEAMADGTHIPFLKQWTAYRDSVPAFKVQKDPKTGRETVYPGMSFEDWKASLPQVSRDGTRVR